MVTGQLAGRLGEGWATPLENHRAGKDKRRFLSEAKDSLGGDVGICFILGMEGGQIDAGILGREGFPLHCFLENQRE